MNPTLLALIICLAAAALEGIMAGHGVRERLASLRMPSYSPSFPLWIVIGVAYYAICFFVLRQLLTRNFTVSLLLLLLILLANAFWNYLFFRKGDLRASFIAFIPYAILVAILVASLINSYPLGAILLLCYCTYLIYAASWGHRLWSLNSR